MDENEQGTPTTEQPVVEQQGENKQAAPEGEQAEVKPELSAGDQLAARWEAWLQAPTVKALAADPELLPALLKGVENGEDLPFEAKQVLATMLAAKTTFEQRAKAERDAEQAEYAKREQELKARLEQGRKQNRSVQALRPDNPAVQKHLAELETRAKGDGRPVDLFADPEEFVARRLAQQEVELTKRMFGMFASIMKEEEDRFSAEAAELAQKENDAAIDAIMQANREYFPEYEDEQATIYDFDGSETTMDKFLLRHANGRPFTPKLVQEALDIAKKTHEFHKAVHAAEAEKTDSVVGRGGRAGQVSTKEPEFGTPEWAKWALQNQDMIVEKHRAKYGSFS